jgi:DNA excision repair protein ERCC-2
MPIRNLQLGVTEFALPVPRLGSIEQYSGFGPLPSVGAEIHAEIQTQRARENEFYSAEKWISHVFVEGDYRITVGGRMDGFLPGAPPLIEEIKTAYQPDALESALARNPEHPYRLQLHTYAYIHYLQNGILPRTRLHLVSARDRATKDLEEAMDPAAVAAWIKRRILELIAEDLAFEKLKKRRKKSAQTFQFPFTAPRPGQPELVQTIASHLGKNGRLLVQAPTGLGKTAAVTFPMLKEAMSRGQKAVYVTAKNSQHAVAEDAAQRLQSTGAKVKSLTLHAKSKMCFKEEVLCNPEYCEFARDHYTKVAEHNLSVELGKKKNLGAKTFSKMGRKYEVCPFDLQMEAVAKADLVICDYNYVFSPRNILGKLTYNGLGKNTPPNLIIDEAHNLPPRANEYFSGTLSAAVVDKEVRRASHLPSDLREAFEGLAIAVRLRIITAAAGHDQRAGKVEIVDADFLDLFSRAQELMGQYLSSGVELMKNDPVLAVCNNISNFAEALLKKTEEFFCTYSPDGPALKITCCDASPWLKETYANFANTVAFSATIKPFDYYAKILGMEGDQLKTTEFGSPFPRERRKLLVIPQVSTRLKDRADNYGKIKDAIEKIVALKPGNYFVFFPSFDFLQKVADRLQLPDFELLRQSREMRREQVDDYIGILRARAKPTLILAVQGGVFAEGVDYPGEMLIGALIVGPALPTFDFERELLREYYEAKYGHGFDYAYTYPAMAKVIQSAGRVIRSSEDRGLIVLMDRRFMHENYLRSMPADWLPADPKSLVSSKILSDIDGFWKSNEP